MTESTSLNASAVKRRQYLLLRASPRSSSPPRFSVSLTGSRDSGERTVKPKPPTSSPRRQVDPGTRGGVDRRTAEGHRAEVARTVTAQRRAGGPEQGDDGAAQSWSRRGSRHCLRRRLPFLPSAPTSDRIGRVNQADGGPQRLLRLRHLDPDRSRPSPHRLRPLSPAGRSARRHPECFAFRRNHLEGRKGAGGRIKAANTPARDSAGHPERCIYPGDPAGRSRRPHWRTVTTQPSARAAAAGGQRRAANHFRSRIKECFVVGAG